ncbi:hypothetical protein LJC49_08895 [Ruminococcaceae bacterium OttesenSCG-928-I18]|nr:hypothetical protein [Ruminococcaceae bacterium OttesenSCG-928-I18]
MEVALSFDKCFQGVEYGVQESGRRRNERPCLQKYYVAVMKTLFILYVIETQKKCALRPHADGLFLYQGRKDGSAHAFLKAEDEMGPCHLCPVGYVAFT